MKFFGGVEGREFGLVAELVCSLVARELGLTTPTPYIVNLSPEFLAGVPKAARDLVQRSLGLNFASESAPPGFGLVPPEPRVPIALRELAAEVFAFDIILQNCDRKSDNPNLLWDGTNFMVIDHERALAFVREYPKGTRSLSGPFRGTHSVLPVRHGFPGPNTLHLVLHALGVPCAVFGFLKVAGVF